MILKQGKFYDEKGNHVPLEFRNKDQIALLNLSRKLKEGVEWWYDDFRCLCGTMIKDVIDKELFDCPSCGAGYQVKEEEGFYGDEIITLKML